MTPTDELRCMLDERRVEHVDEKDGKFLLVTWSYNETSATFVEDTVSGETSIAISAIVSPEQAIAATLGSCNCSNSERTDGTCHADETGRFSFHVWNGGLVTVHVMECSECGGTYEHVNGDYEFCPRCGRRIEEVDV